ncbi:MAG: class I SAM-dependent methyltransferase [Candidatus Acidiferrales bacterium]
MPRLKAKHFCHPLRTLVMAYGHYSSAFYDWTHGIRTADIEPLSTLELTRPENLTHANPYTPSQPADIRSVFRNLELDFRDYCFVDFGCGKGRVLAEAARYPFKSVIGVDFARELCEASKANLERVRSTRRCGGVQVLHADATEFDLPQDPCVVYIYNSFRGPVLAAVLERIRKSVVLFPRHIRIAYVTPMLPEFFLQVPGIRVFKSNRRYAMYDLGDSPAGL